MYEIRLRQSGSTYSACGLITKKHITKKKIKESSDSRYMCQKNLIHAYYHNDMAYGDLKDLSGTSSDNVLLDKAFDIAKNKKYDSYQRGIAAVIYKFFDKKWSGGAAKRAIYAKPIFMRRTARMKI